MKRPTRDLILSFIQANPGTDADEICEAIFLDSSYAHGHLAAMVNNGLLISSRAGRKYVYVAAQAVNQHIEATLPPVKDAITKAEEDAAALIARGLPRRAATRLTEAMSGAHSESEMRRLANFRTRCVKSIKRSTPRTSI
jgi:predicted ArsR family transcriptional regulator